MCPRALYTDDNNDNTGSNAKDNEAHLHKVSQPLAQSANKAFWSKTRQKWTNIILKYQPKALWTNMRQNKPILSEISKWGIWNQYMSLQTKETFHVTIKHYEPNLSWKPKMRHFEWNKANESDLPKLDIKEIPHICHISKLARMHI